MGFFDPPKRPTKIKLLNVENKSSKAIITYMATYADKSTQNIRMPVQYLRSSFYYLSNPRIIKAECLGKVYIGFIKSDVRLIFLVTLSDGTMDMIQEQEGTTRCNNLLAKTMNEDPSEDTHKDTYKNTTTKSNKTGDRRMEKDMNIPIQILPNEYNLSVANVSLKHVISDVGTSHFDYVSLKCRVNYSLNGKKAGKRKIVFVSYDTKGGVLEICEQYPETKFTDVGFEFVKINFDKPQLTGISVYVKEL